MKVVWTSGALQDRLDIWDYIAADKPSAAARMDQLFSDAAEGLASFPDLGKDGMVPGTRELLVHVNYRLVYEIASDTVWILTLVHTSQLWPPLRG